MAESYRNKSFTMLDVLSYFFVNQVLGNQEMSLAEILELMPVVTDEIVTLDDMNVDFSYVAQVEDAFGNVTISTPVK